jgi:hypothetical protein
VGEEEFVAGVVIVCGHDEILRGQVRMAHVWGMLGIRPCFFGSLSQHSWRYAIGLREAACGSFCFSRNHVDHQLIILRCHHPFR